MQSGKLTCIVAAIIHYDEATNAGARHLVGRRMVAPSHSSSSFGVVPPEGQLLETSARVCGGQSWVGRSYERCYSREPCTDQTDWLLRPSVFMDYIHGHVVSYAVIMLLSNHKRPFSSYSAHLAALSSVVLDSNLQLSKSTSSLD